MREETLANYKSALQLLSIIICQPELINHPGWLNEVSIVLADSEEILFWRNNKNVT